MSLPYVSLLHTAGALALWEPRKISEGTESAARDSRHGQMGEYSYDMGDRQMHLSQYIVESGDQNLLIEAGAGDEREMREAIRGETSPHRPEVLLFTNSIPPHTENHEMLESEWSEIKAMSATHSPNQVGVEETALKMINESKELGGENFSFIHPLLTDIVASNWVHSHIVKTLFISEGPGQYHQKGQELATSSNFENGIAFEMIHRFNEVKLRFLNFVDPEKLRTAFEAIFDDFDVEYIAPIHGNPVEPADVDAYIDRVTRPVREFDQPYLTTQRRSSVISSEYALG